MVCERFVRNCTNKIAKKTYLHATQFQTVGFIQGGFGLHPVSSSFLRDSLRAERRVGESGRMGGPMCQYRIATNPI
jgi:hypothetical protein